MSSPNVNARLTALEALLPPPSEDATVLLRVVTDPLTPGGAKDPPTVWVLNKPQPLSDDTCKILRMYRTDKGVDVYSSDGNVLLRTSVPERYVRFTDEMMEEGTFVAFIEQAESGEEEPEEPEQEPQPSPTPQPGDTGPS